MTSTPARTIAVIATSVVMLFSAGCNRAEPPLTPQATPPATPQASAIAPKRELNAQGVAFANMTYLDDLRNAIQGNDAFISMEEGLTLSRIDLRVDANTYAKDYDANEIAADNKYKGKKILLIGKINSINKDIGGNGYLALRGPGMFQDVQARLSDAGMEGAADLAKGMTVYLVCDHGMKVATMTTARNCQRYSQHLDALRPSIEKSIVAFLSGDLAMPNSHAQAVVAGYVLGTELPAGSPCLTNANACEAELAQITNDTARQHAFKAKADALLKSLKTT
jgi:hypothetical protein